MGDRLGAMGDDPALSHREAAAWAEAIQGFGIAFLSLQFATTCRSS